VGLALVARIPSLVEAHIATGALRSAGIDAQVFDANFGQVEAPVIESLGGFRIMAPAEQTAEAREILKALRAGPGLGDPEDVAPWSASLARSSAQRSRRAAWAFGAVVALALVFWVLRALAW
jgi:hypothetical protein